jgi:uncharacterized protein (UPF0332 family)
MLQASGLRDDAISRAYYAMMHATRAVLYSHEAIPESHGAVRRLFGQVLIQTHEIERAWGRLLTDTYDQRLLADYSGGSPLGIEDVTQLVRDAHRFVERLATYLTAKNVPLEPPAESPPA